MTHSDTYTAAEDRAASLFITFGRSHGAVTMVQGQRRIIDDLDEGVDFMLSDDTGMDTYDHNAPNESFPLSLHFKGRTAQDVAEGLKAVLDAHGFSTDESPSVTPNGRLRVMRNVFVHQRDQDVFVEVPNMP